MVRTYTHQSCEYPIIRIDFLYHIWCRVKKFGLHKHVDVHTADQLSFTTQPAIKRWPQLNKSDFASSSRTRDLISYARKHADRNSYALLIDSLSVAVCEGIFKGNWKFMGWVLCETISYILAHIVVRKSSLTSKWIYLNQNTLNLFVWWHRSFLNDFPPS